MTAASIFDLKAEIDRLREGLRWIAAGKTGSYGHAEDFAKAILDGGPTKAASAASAAQCSDPFALYWYREGYADALRWVLENEPAPEDIEDVLETEADRHDRA